MAFIRKRGGCFQLVETYRDGDKVRQRLIAGLEHHDTPEAALSAYCSEYQEPHYATPRIRRRRERLTQRIAALECYLSGSVNLCETSSNL